MRMELRVCTRCCFCLPLRYGLIVWGYVKLITSCIVLAMVTYILKDAIRLSNSEEESYRSTFYLVVIATVGIAAVIDLGLTITYIVGCYKKNVKLLRIYYYHIKILLILTIVFNLCGFGMAMYLTYQYSLLHDSDIILTIVLSGMMDAMVQIANVAFQIYILLLVRSEIVKLENGTQFRFVNMTPETECTLEINEANAEQETEKKGKGVDNEDEIRINV